MVYIRKKHIHISETKRNKTIIENSIILQLQFITELLYGVKRKLCKHFIHP